MKKLTKTATLPTKATEGSSGYGLYSDVEIHISPGERRIISTGISVELPPGYELQVRSRSGLAAKRGLVTLNSPGTIDSDYRGEIKGLLYNSSKTKYQTIFQGDRIAQLVLQKVPVCEYYEVEELSDTSRGTGGFGSTGLGSTEDKIAEENFSGRK